MCKSILIGSLFLTFASQHLSAQDHKLTYDDFKKGFNNPPQQAHPESYWWWLNGNTETARLMKELTAMKNVGIGGVDIFDIGARAPNNPDKMIPGGPAFMGPEALATLVKVIKKATEYNMEVGLSLSSSWNAGGSWITPEYAGKSLYYSTIKVQGPGLQKITVPFPTISRLDEKARRGSSFIMRKENLFTPKKWLFWHIHPATINLTVILQKLLMSLHFLMARGMN